MVSKIDLTTTYVSNKAKIFVMLLESNWDIAKQYPKYLRSICRYFLLLYHLRLLELIFVCEYNANYSRRGKKVTSNFCIKQQANGNKN